MRLPEAIEEDPAWQQFVREALKPTAPEIKPYRSGDSIEKWIEDSARREGYELCLAQLNISLGDPDD